MTPRFRNPSLNTTDENRLRVEMSLAVGESRTIDLAIPYFALPEQAANMLASLRFEDELAGFRIYWEKELNRQTQFVLPESRIRDAYRACLANNLILTDRNPKTGVLMPHPDATSYEAVWSGDSGVIIQAMDRMGYHKEAESMLDYFLAMQGTIKPDGDVLSAEGFFCGDVDLRWMNQDGFILWAMSEHYKLTHNETWLRKVAPQLIKGCDWIIRERARTKTLENDQKPKHYGLLPKGRPSDLYIWDHWYWSDTYSYMGLRGTADVLAAIGMKDEAKRLSDEADDYKACIIDSVERSTDPAVKPPFVPPSPYRNRPTHIRFLQTTPGTRSAARSTWSRPGLLDARSEKAAGINYWIEKCGLFSGMPRVHVRLDRSLLRLQPVARSVAPWGDGQVRLDALQPERLRDGPGHLLHHRGPEPPHRSSNGESWDANRQPHMHSNSRYMDLVRIALLLEEGDTLHLLAGAPRGWLADGQNIEVKHTPSYFGEVNYGVTSRVGKGEVTFKIEPTQWQAANGRTARSTADAIRTDQSGDGQRQGVEGV